MIDGLYVETGPILHVGFVSKHYWSSERLIVLIDVHDFPNKQMLGLVCKYQIIKNIGNMVMSLLPDTQNCGCACAGDAGDFFPVTAGERSQHASRDVRHARAVMHAGIAN